MAARTFTDSAGLTWEVFEVHRASQKAGAVSAGLEQGWLAFASGENKRRLAPFPSDWAACTDAQLEALCTSARQAPAPRYPLDQPVRPRIRRSRLSDGDSGAAPDLNTSTQRTAPRSGTLESGSPLATSSSGTPVTEVEATVRAFAHEARARGLPAVAAMLELKTVLQERHPEVESLARDRKLVRRWFVESYYFERNA